VKGKSQGGEVPHSSAKREGKVFSRVGKILKKKGNLRRGKKMYEKRPENTIKGEGKLDLSSGIKDVESPFKGTVGLFKFREVIV